ncbi:MAG: hypothetical protein IPO38_08425 [Rhodocyclaceae bacterium]|nr:hypothetical protein [Rhodocyclaceae bacterium]
MGDEWHRRPFTSTNALTYSGFATLQGGSAVDTFTLGAASTANIKGGGGIDVLALATNTLTGSFAGEAAGGSITGIGSAVLTAAGVVGFNGTSANVAAGFTDVGSLTGTGTLTGINTASAWSVTGAGGTYTSTNTLTYNGFATLQGGSAVDTFTLASGTSFAGNIDGGGGVDELKATDGSNTWVSNAANAGTLNTNTVFSNIETLTGGSGSDSLVGTGGVYHFTAIDSGTYNGMSWSSVDTVTDSGGGTFIGDFGSQLSGPLSGLGATTLSGIITAATMQFTGATTLAAATELTASTVTFGNTLNATTKGTEGLIVTGNTVFNNAVGNSKEIGALAIIGTTTFNTGATSVTTDATANTGNQSYSGTVTLNDNLSLLATGAGTIALNGSLSGNARNLTVNAATAVALGDGTGTDNFTGLSSIDVSGPTTIRSNGITTSGTQRYRGAVTLGLDDINKTKSLTATSVTFDSTVNATTKGTEALAVTGNAIFNNTVGVAKELGAVSVSGTTAFNAGATAVMTDSANTGGQAYSGAVTLNDDVSFIASGAGVIAFNGGVTGNAHSLTVSAPTTVVFGDGVGADSLLGLSSLDVTGPTQIKSQAVTTSGTQRYRGTVALGVDDANKTKTLTGSTVTFDSIVNATTKGTEALAIVGNSVFNGSVGAVTELGALSVSGTTLFKAGATTVNTDATANTGNQSYSGAVTLNENVGIGANIVTFSNTLDATTKGTEALSITGNAVFNSTVGNTKELGALAVSGTTTFNAGATSVKTDATANTGNQTYSGLVTLNDNLSLLATTAGTIALNGALTGNANSLTISAPTLVRFGDGVGADSLLGLSSLDVTGPTQIKSQAVTTSGTQRYRGTVALGVDDANKTKTLTGSTVTFDSIVNATTKGTEALAIVGNSVFNGSVGAVTELGALSVSGTTLFKAGATTVNTDATANTGNQSYSGAVTLNENVGIGANIVTFSNTLDATTKGTEALSITGNAVFNSTVGNTKELGALAVSGTTTFNAGATSVKTDATANTGNQTYSGLVTLNDNLSLLATTAGTIALNGALTGNAKSLTISAPTLVRFGDGIGADSLLGLSSLDVTGPTQIKSQAVTTSGTQRYRGGVTLGIDGVNKTKTLTGSTVTFNNTVVATTKGMEALVITGNAVFDNTVGNLRELGALAISGTTIFNPGATIVRTDSTTNTGNQTYSGLVTLNENLSLLATGVTGTIALNGALAGNAHSLAISAPIVLLGDGTGADNLLGLTTLDVTGLTLIKSQSVSASGTQRYRNGVTIGLDDTNKTKTLSGTTVSFDNTLNATNNGTEALAVTGDAVFSNTVGNTMALGALAISGATTFNVGATSVKTNATANTGNQTYSGLVTLNENLNLLATGTAGTIALNGALTGNAHSLTISAPTIVKLGDGAGADSLLGLTTLDVADPTLIKSQAITTSGTQRYRNTVALGQDDANKTKTLTGTTVTFDNTLNASNRGTDALVVTGNAVFNNTVGNAVELGALAITGTTTFNAGATSVKTDATANTGNQTYSGLVTLNENLSLLATVAGSIALNGALTGNAHSLALSAPTSVLLGDGTGADSLLGLTTFDVTGPTQIKSQAVTSSGAQRYRGTVALGVDDANKTKTLTGTTVTFDNTLNATTKGTEALSVVGNTTFNNTVGSLKELGALTMGGTTTFNSGATGAKTDAAANTGNQSYVGAVSGTGLSLSSGTGSVTAINSANDFAGTLTLSSKGSSVTDANALTVVLNDLASASVISGGALVVSGDVATNLTVNSANTISFGTTTVTGGYLDATGAGNITQTGKLSVGGNLWMLTTAGNIDLGGYQNINNVIDLVNPYVNHLGGTVSLTAPMATVVGGAATQPGSDVSLMADRINVGTVRTSNSSLSDVGITAARVTLRVQDPDGGPKIAATGAEGLITANQPRDLTHPQLAALTLLANGYIGDPATPNVTTVGLRVATTGLVVVDTKLAGPNTIMLVGNPALQPVYPDSGKVGFRSVKYNGVEATSEQLTGALDAAYLDIRNQTIEIRESGFAKENANKILRRGVVTSAGPGQPAVDDSTGMAQLDSCDGNFINDALICQ